MDDLIQSDPVVNGGCWDRIMGFLLDSFTENLTKATSKTPSLVCVWCPGNSAIKWPFLGDGEFTHMTFFFSKVAVVGDLQRN